MRLRVTTPLAIILDVDGVVHVRAEDATGSFGVAARHAPFLTVLTLSIVAWRDAVGRERYVAVRGGTFSVRGDAVELATREAVAGDDLQALERDVLARFRQHQQSEASARASIARLELAAMRRIYDYLRGERTQATHFEVGDEQRP